MGLLDSDAEELKKNNTTEAKSGRKVNQSGLGAFRGLSKYSSLTSKYRTTGKESVPPTLPVEQSRGTNSMSVQSHPEVGAKSVQNNSTDLNQESLSLHNSDVSAKQVQSQDEVSAASGGVSTINVVSKAGAMSVQSEIENDFLSKKIDDLQVNVSNTFEIDNSEKSDSKSVQIVTREASIEDIEANERSNVSAKSVLLPMNDDSILATSNFAKSNELNSSQSRCDVGALQINSKKIEVKNDDQIDFKLGANSVRSNDKVSALAQKKFIKKPLNKVSAKYVQSGDGVGAKSVQAGMPSFQFSPDSFQGFPETIKQINSKCIPKNIDNYEPTESVISLSGSQRALIEFFYQLCVWNNSLITPPITKQYLIQETGLSTETALSSIKRLRNKYIIDRHAYKDGKAGWTQYKISETSYKELVHMHQIGGRQSQQRVAGDPLAPKYGKPSAQSTIPYNAVSGPTWFKELDFTSVRPIGPMVVNASIRAMVQEKLTPDLVQEFLNRFTTWLATQGKISSPIGLFCDKLKELAKEGDSPVLACQTEAERAIEAEYAKSVAKAKLEIEMIQKSKSSLDEQAINDRLEEEFQLWFDRATDESKIELSQPSGLAPLGSEYHRTSLKAAYREKVFKLNDLKL